MNKSLVALLLSSATATIILLSLYVFCPKPELQQFIPYSKVYFDNEGKMLRFTLAQDERYRLYEKLENISDKLIEASILYEDQYYYQHAGVDVMALLRAFWSTYITQERRIGASTIVMQLARLRWQIPSNTLSGKLVQISRAIQLSRHYSKRQILEAYLNLTPYGRNIEGIAAASWIYFNKSPADLSLPEALSLAVIPQNPNKRNPTSEAGYKHLIDARRRLFKRWINIHPEDQKSEVYLDLPLAVRSPENLPFKAPHFINYLQQKISPWLSGIVATTLDSDKQQQIENVLKTYISSNATKGIYNASALLVNYKTRSIEVMVGSADFYADNIFGQVNGTTAKRSPGSALKPFVYALAMDEGLIHPLTLLKDSPRQFGGFTPENYDKKFLGPLSAKEALIESRNVPAVVLQSQLQQTSFFQFLSDADIQGLKNEDFYGLALALGGGEVTALELAGLYAMLANGGVNYPIQALQTIHPGVGRRLLSAEASYLTLDMLKDNPAPDAIDLSLDQYSSNDIAWKTGTSWAFRDAWAVGISGPYVLIVWVGNFNGDGNPAFIGRTAAGPLFFRIFDVILPTQDWRFETAFKPENMNLKRLKVCANTGDLYEKHCPASVETWFIPGVSPIKVSNIYRQILIDNHTGLRACEQQPGKTQLKVFEFWPSDFLQIYQQAGISLKSPPPFMASCSLDQTSSAGLKPVMTSPQSSIEYMVRLHQDSSSRIPLTAIVDADVQHLHWFIEDEYIGSTERDRPLFLNAQPGIHHIRVVDDSGRSASKKITVMATNL